MGILTDFVIAKKTDAEAIGRSSRPSNDWPTLEAKSVDLVKLSMLYCAVVNSCYSSAVASSFQFVGGNQDEGPWVFQFPTHVLTAIASIPEKDLALVAFKWAHTEQMQADGWCTADAAEFIGCLRRQARQAMSADSLLFLWLSL